MFGLIAVITNGDFTTTSVRHSRENLWCDVVESIRHCFFALIRIGVILLLSLFCYGAHNDKYAIQCLNGISFCEAHLHHRHDVKVIFSMCFEMDCFCWNAGRSYFKSGSVPWLVAAAQLSINVTMSMSWSVSSFLYRHCCCSEAKKNSAFSVVSSQKSTAWSKMDLHYVRLVSIRNQPNNK